MNMFVFFFFWWKLVIYRYNTNSSSEGTASTSLVINGNDALHFSETCTRCLLSRLPSPPPHISLQMFQEPRRQTVHLRTNIKAYKGTICKTTRGGDHSRRFQAPHALFFTIRNTFDEGQRWCIRWYRTTICGGLQGECRKPLKQERYLVCKLCVDINMCVATLRNRRCQC